MFLCLFSVPNVRTSTPEMTSTVASVISESPISAEHTINRTPKKSFKEYINFPIHDLSNDQFFAASDNNITWTGLSTDADNLSFIELSSDSELFEVIELDY